MPLPSQETYNQAFGGGAWQAPMTGASSFMKALQDAQTLAREQERQAMLDQRYDKEQATAQDRWAQEMDLKRRILAQKAPQAGPSREITPGRKAADVAFGKEYADWSGGGFAQTEKGLSALKDAKAALMAPDAKLSGPVRGAFPDWLRAGTNPQAVDVKESIRGAVMNTLRATLGAQFTEKEGERIFNLAYNDRLPPESNVKRLDRLVTELENMAKSKQSMADYFEQHGTLTGWQGRPVVAGGFDEAMFNDAPAQAPTNDIEAKRRRLEELRAKRGM